MAPVTYGRKGQSGSLAKPASAVEQKKLAAATELVENDDLLVYLFLDTLTSRRRRLGAHYQNQKWAEDVGDERPGQTLRVLQGSIRQTLIPVRESFLGIPLLAQHCQDKEKTELHRLLTHLDRYIRLFHSTSRIEILPTHRYTQVTGKKELAVYATAPLSPSGPEGVEMWECGGQLTAMPGTWDKDLEKESEDDGIWTRDGFLMPPIASSSTTDATPSPSRNETPPATSATIARKAKRGFSIVESTRHGPCMYLGPGRFINHDCEPNCQLIPKSGMSMTFRVVKPIKVGEELTTFYGGSYFGVGNRECMCASCEKAGVGWYSETREASVDTEAGPSTSISDVSLMVTSDHDTPERDGESESSLMAAKILKEAASKWKTRLHRSRVNEQNGVKVNVQTVSGGMSKQGRKGGAVEARADKVMVHDPRDPPGTNRCETCLGVIAGGRQGRGKVQTACFRCRRHWKIYHLPWPARTTATVAARPPRHLTPSWFKDYKMEVPLGVVASRILREGALLSRNLAARTPAHEEIVVERCEPEERVMLADAADNTKRKGKARRTEAKKPAVNVAALPPSWTALKAMPSILQEPPETTAASTPQPESEPIAPPVPKKKRSKAQDESLKKGNGLWLKWEWAEVEETPEFVPVILPEGSKRSRRGGPSNASGASETASKRPLTRSRRNASPGTSRATSRATSQPQNVRSSSAEEEQVSDAQAGSSIAPDAALTAGTALEADQNASTSTDGRDDAPDVEANANKPRDVEKAPTIGGTPTLDDMAERETSTRKRRRSQSSSSSSSSSGSVQNDAQWAGPVIKLADLAKRRRSNHMPGSGRLFKTRLEAESVFKRTPVFSSKLPLVAGLARASEGDDDDVDMVLDEELLSDPEVAAYDSDGTPGPEASMSGCKQQ